MAASDYLELGGKLLIAWSSGYAFGYVMGIFKRFSEQV